MFVKRYLEFRMQRNRILDAIDSQIEGRNMQASLVEQKPMQETEGFTVRGMPELKRKTQEERQDYLKDIFDQFTRPNPDISGTVAEVMGMSGT